MRALRASLLALILVFTSILVFEVHAAAKNGSTCSKLGAKAKVGSQTFLCVKSGSKKIWRVQKTISTQVNPVSPNPTSSASNPVQGTPTPTPTPTQIDYKSMENKDCEVLGQKVDLNVEYLECRPIANKKAKWFLLKRIKDAQTPNLISTPVKECMIKDARKDTRGLSSGFPLYKNVPSVGKVKVAVIPIDFEDTVGNYSAEEAINPHVEKVDAWLKQFTSGNLTYDWKITKSWIRNTKSIGSYGVGKTDHFGYFNDQELVQDLLTSSDPQVDFTDVKIVLFVFPRTITELPIQVIGQNQRLFKTNEGTIGNYWGGGKFAYQQDFEKLLWAIWIHETLHMHGLPEHAPGNGWPLTITSNQYGTALVIDSWESFLAGWLDEKSIICLSQNSIGNSTFTLTPLDRNRAGTKSIMIPLSDHEILVIESRRSEDFSIELNPEVYGLTAYVVDTSKENDRTGESSGKDNGNDPAYSKFAYYLNSTSGDHQTIRLKRGMLDTNILAYEGESFIYRGIKITLVKSGDFDTVQIQKVG